MTAQRCSRNTAAAGMFGVMALSVLCAWGLYEEKVWNVPPLHAQKITVMHAQFRTLPQKKAPPPAMKKILAE